MDSENASASAPNSSAVHDSCFWTRPTSGLDPSAESRLSGVAAPSCGDRLHDSLHHAHHGVTRFCLTGWLSCAAAAWCSSENRAQALEYFGVERLTLLYEGMSCTPGADWPAHREGPPPLETVRVPPQRQKRNAALPILLRRQWAIFLLQTGRISCWRWASPFSLGCWSPWVSGDPPLILFFAYIATLWFGCGNAAQEIVRELPMFRRERLIGLRSSCVFVREVLFACRHHRPSRVCCSTA